MLQQELDHLLAGDVILRPEAELREALVLADEIARRPGEQREEAGQGSAVGWGLQVLDDVARDAALAQDVQRAARLASPGVVVDRHLLHGGGVAAARIPRKRHPGP